MVDTSLKRLAAMRKPGNWLIAAIEGVEESNGEGRQDSGWFHPSDFGNECDAFMAFKFLGAPAREIISAKLRRIFDNGTGRDTFLKEDIQKSGVSLVKKPEDRLIRIPSLRIRGELDEWVQNPLTKEKFVVDIKTMNSREWEALEAVKKAHYLQLHPYMFDKQSYKGLVLYENKNTQDFKTMQADFDGKIWQEQFVERIERILDGIEKNTVYRNPIHCGSCPFFDNGVCTANQIAKLKEESGLYESS